MVLYKGCGFGFLYEGKFKYQKDNFIYIEDSFSAMDSKSFWKIIAQIFNEKELRGEVDKQRWWKTEQVAEVSQNIL